jgi:hypothetical protein
VFSNSVQARHITSLQEWLHDKGFAVTDTKERASAHLLHHGKYASYSLSFIKTRWVCQQAVTCAACRRVAVVEPCRDAVVC